MSNVVYLMTSLPSLTFGQAPPISMEEFQYDAENQLSARHFKTLESVDMQLMNASGKGMKKIAALLSGVQNDLSEARSAKLQNRQPGLGIMPKAVLAGNPLQREQNILRWQWEELDSIEAGKTFTMTEVLVYKLKLQILQRMHLFDDTKGAEVLASVINPSKKREGK